MWRDRTNLYISYRQSYAHHPAKKTRYGAGPGGGGSSNGGFGASSDALGRSSAMYGGEDTQGLLSGADYLDDGDAVIEMDLLPPRWADISDEVTEHLEKIVKQSHALERLHQKHVLPGFNDDEAKRAEEDEIDRLTRGITRAFHDCHKCIQTVEKMVKESRSSPQGMTSAEETMARNIQVSLAAKVQEASAGFRKKQSAYLKKLRGMSGLERSSTPLGGTSSSSAYAAASSEADPSLLESESDKSYSVSALQQQQHQTLLHSDDSVIAQREREIESIAQGIIELSDMFRDLQTMVIDQGTMLDRIDYNVERMNTDVKGAEKELIIADGYQKKTTKRKLILLLILLIVGAIILLVITKR
ncbi:putative syntaxin family protein [Microdochium bolleyi]|uniref:Putative syntaxin family protein n=1 Tax=Microdochium bolleyi TaxID=196109 RepID=A0A136J6G2_9PEZI|nr:putative syntaxin family protein [Microdochium bolleyi]